MKSGRTQVKGAKATSTDSPPKGYGTPNLVGSYWCLVGLWDLYISVRVSVTGLGPGLFSRSYTLAALPHPAGDRPEGQVGCRSEDASLYYKSRPEGTWGSPHDTSPTRLTVSVPSDAGLRSKASEVRGSHRCHGTARCTAAS